MKHAILIMAHKNYSFLHHLIEYFERDCYVFVHIDKKSDITKEEIACLREMPQVTEVYQKYSVHWGGFSILKCELFLLKTAMKNCDSDYFHLISGQDYPIRPLNRFLEFFIDNKGKNFFQYIHLPNFKWEKNTYDRFSYFYLYDCFQKKNDKTIRMISRFIDFQKRMGFKRSIPNHFSHLFGGSQWFSITRDAVKIILEYTRKKPAFLRRLKYTFAPEECYISTVLKNLLPHETIVPNNLRYIRWKYENGNSPANLGKDHFLYLLESDAFFARKFESSFCEQLVELIDKYLHVEENECERTVDEKKEYNGFLGYDCNRPFIFEIQRWCYDYSIKTVLDIGCGAGYNVAKLRHANISASGVDTNRFTPLLSSLLLPVGDLPCSIADITKDFQVKEIYEMVICVNTISYLSVNQWDIAIENISKATKKIAIIGFPIYEITSGKEQIMISLFLKNKMVLEVLLSNSLRTLTRNEKNKKNYYVFRKENFNFDLIQV